MSQFTVSRDIVPQLDQLVYVSGQLWSGIRCTSISLGCGVGTTTAQFVIPQGRFDDARDDLHEALVVVYVINVDGRTPTAPDFAGYLDAESATLSASEDGYTLSARTATAFLDRASIGLEAHRAVVTYPIIDPVTGRATKWTAARILQDLFGSGGATSPSGGLGSYWRAIVAIGNVSDISSVSTGTEPTIVFRSANYVQAIEQCLAMFGDVTFTERFDGAGKCYLDFFRIMGGTRGTVSARVAALGQDIVEAGANVESMSRNKTSADVKTRIVCYGTPRRFVVSCTTADATAEKKLVDGWDASLAAAVLKQPKIAKPSAKGYLAGMEHVYRTYRLPACFRGYQKLKDLVVKRADGERVYSVQVWKYPTVLTADGSGNLTGAVSATPVLLQNVKLDLDKDQFTLGSAEDGLNPTAVSTGGTGMQLTTWARATIGITFTFEHSQWVYGDTGQDNSGNVRFPFARDGLTEAIPRDDCTFLQFTNAGYTLSSQTGVSLTFGALLFNEDTGAWVTYSAATISQDDSAKLRRIATETLRARFRRHKSGPVTIPVFARAYSPGRLLRFEGLADEGRESLMITGTEFDLDENQTTVTWDNVKPPLRGGILAKQ